MKIFICVIFIIASISLIAVGRETGQEYLAQIGLAIALVLGAIGFTPSDHESTRRFKSNGRRKLRFRIILPSRH